MIEAKRTQTIILENLTQHHVGAQEDRAMLGYFTWKQCLADNRKSPRVCDRFRLLGSTANHKAH